MVDHSSTAKANAAPDPDDPRKADSPTDLRKPSWTYVFRRSAREFSKDQCTDLAAALTYYAVLSLFPALIALVSLLGVFGQGQETTDALIDTAGGVVPEDSMETLRGVIDGLVTNQAAGLGLVIGLAGALWSASGYVGAFGRAMNRIYEIDEGRPFWKLRPVMLVITLVALLLVVLAAVLLVVSGPVAETIGDAVGLGSTALTVWNIAKWPVLIVIVITVIALLYYATPNVQQPKFRWLSMGALIAVVVWIVASLGFGFYVANFGSYNETYGSLAGVVIFLLWLWITNLALLFGAEFDAETERGRQLQAGMVAEETIQLPPRDTRKSEKAEEKYADDVRRGRELRQQSQNQQGDRDENPARGDVRGDGEDDGHDGGAHRM